MSWDSSVEVRPKRAPPPRLATTAVSAAAVADVVAWVSKCRTMTVLLAGTVTPAYSQ